MVSWLLDWKKRERSSMERKDFKWSRGLGMLVLRYRERQKNHSVIHNEAYIRRNMLVFEKALSLSQG